MLSPASEKVIDAWLRGERKESLHFLTDGRWLMGKFDPIFAPTAIGYKVYIKSRWHASLIGYGVFYPFANSYKARNMYHHERLCSLVNYACDKVTFFDTYEFRDENRNPVIDSYTYQHDKPIYIPTLRAIFRKHYANGIDMREKLLLVTDEYNVGSIIVGQKLLECCYRYFRGKRVGNALRQR